MRMNQPMKRRKKKQKTKEPDLSDDSDFEQFMKDLEEVDIKVLESFEDRVNAQTQEGEENDAEEGNEEGEEQGEEEAMVEDEEEEEDSDREEGKEEDKNEEEDQGGDESDDSSSEADPMSSDSDSADDSPCGASDDSASAASPNDAVAHPENAIVPVGPSAVIAGGAATAAIVPKANSVSHPNEFAMFSRICNNRGKFPVKLSEHLQRDKLDLFNQWLEAGKNMDELCLRIERKVESVNRFRTGREGMKARDIEQKYPLRKQRSLWLLCELAISFTGMKIFPGMKRRYTIIVASPRRWTTRTSLVTPLP